MHAVSERGFDALVAGLYDAALDPTRWQDALDLFADSFGGQAVLFSQDFHRAGANIAASARVNGGPELFARYESYYSKRKPWLARLDRIPPGGIVTLDGLIDEPSYRRTEYYNDFLASVGAYYLLGSILRKEGAATTVATIMRSSGGGDFTAEELATARRLTPHFQRAIQMHRQLYAAELERNGMLRGLDALGIAAFLAAADGTVIFANAKAEAILRRGQGLHIAQSRLRATDPASSQRLLHLVNAAALTGAGRGADAGGLLLLPRRLGPPLSLLVCPVPIDRVALGAARPAALVFISDPADRAVPRHSDILRLYGLTPAEARLVSALVAGTSLKDYADGARLTLATVKTQLRAAFAKTGQNRQSDLIRLVLTNSVARAAGALLASGK